MPDSSQNAAQRDSRRRGQFQLRHLLGLTAGAAVLFAVLAPWFRDMAPDVQLDTALKAAAMVVAVVVIVAVLLAWRLKVERNAGPLIENFERRSSRILYWLILTGLWGGYVGSIWLFAGPASIQPVLPGSPWMLFYAVSYFVIRGWWGIDPQGLEARRNGLVARGFVLLAWDDIARYTWSGSPPRQLNVFLKRRFVVNLKTDAAFVNRLDEILAERVPGAARVSQGIEDAAS